MLRTVSQPTAIGMEFTGADAGGRSGNSKACTASRTGVVRKTEVLRSLHIVSAMRRPNVRCRTETIRDDSLDFGCMSTNVMRATTRTAASLAMANARLLCKVAQLERLAAASRHGAFHDSLTGLPNRALLLERLNQALLLGMRTNMTAGVLMVDLDGFKAVNDRFGHRMGDLLLQQVAARVLGCIRASDTACRYGGDEFVIMVPQARGARETLAVNRKLAAQLSLPYQLGEHLVAVGANIGTAVFNGEATGCDALMHAADSAMYAAKANSIAASWRRCDSDGSRDFRQAGNGTEPSSPNVGPQSKQAKAATHQSS